MIFDPKKIKCTVYTICFDWMPQNRDGEKNRSYLKYG